ncbi:class I SAM-dependent methyltransferase [Butyrivibrio sp. FC2001]|uniref:class I SAM-dependent methyltransferase n=1 Tax=Butyrivibrio sp. FC2001 TaxID=1280671 RepID=UPI00040E2223|nr:methyltransferase domain-containing protein [Butyrivibrio sp. FC2001]
MKQGDFTELAKYYVDRPGYSKELLRYVSNRVMVEFGDDIVVADVGAGTGKLTSNLYEIGMRGYAVEPNDAMRNEGIKIFSKIPEFLWKKGAAEATGLDEHSVNWLLMGSSFHWADATKASIEFKRVLKANGYFTAIWNPRDVQRNELFVDIEEMIHRIVPELKRVSSGASVTTEIIKNKLGGNFKNIVFMEAEHEEIMSKERYINIWRSVNDIQSQAGPERFEMILNNIDKMLTGMKEIAVPYKSRAWTAQVC